MPPAAGVRFVINADDLGATDSINEAVFAAIADGVITSATIMATGAALDAALKTTKSFPAASFGVHMNITEHAPLTSAPHLAPLLDDGGSFRRDAVYEVQWTPSLLDAVVAEWVAQVRRIQQGGVEISHLDSHHHTHTVPGLFRALKRVQRETGIRKVRGTWSVYDRASMAPLSLRLKKRAWWWALRRVYATTTTSEFSDFLVFLRAVAEGSYAPASWPESIELMVHPDLGPANAEETAALRKGWLKSLPVPATLVSYRAL